MAACSSGENGKTDEELVKEALQAYKWNSSQMVGDYHTAVELTFEDDVYQTRVIVNAVTISATMDKYEVKNGCDKSIEELSKIVVTCVFGLNRE